MSNNQIIVLEVSGIQAELQANDNAIAALKDKYSIVPTEYKALSAAYSEVRQVRLAIDKRWEARKKEIKNYRAALDTEAERLINLVVAIETPLKEAKHAIDEAKKREEVEKARIEAERLQKILARINVICDTPYNTRDSIEDLKLAIQNLSTLCSDFDFMEHTEKARESFRISMQNLKDRLKQKEDFEEQQAKLAEERRKLEEEQIKIRLENEEKQRIAAAELKAQQDAIAEEKRQLDEEKAALAAEKLRQSLELKKETLLIDDPIKNMPMSESSPSNEEEKIDTQSQTATQPHFTIPTIQAVTATTSAPLTIYNETVSSGTINPINTRTEKPSFHVELSEANDNGISTLTIIHNGVVIGEYYDGREPEDNYFYRDLSYVPSAIKKAYKLGFEDGKNSK